MADESPVRIEALKKVYAEIILNTSKDAASRVMAAERKALGFHHDLVSLKEESLRMFLRLKDNFDFKITETEARTVNQQLKIEELEAQLSEAEGIIMDLRDELKQVHEKLEIMGHHQKQPLSGNMLRVDEHANEHMLPDNMLSSSSLVMTPVSGEKYASVECETSIASLHRTGQGNNNFDSTSGNNLSSNSHLDHLQIGSLANDNETELHRNGFTQRIRAFEKNLSTINFPSPREDHQPVINVLSETEKEKADSSRHCQITERMNTDPQDNLGSVITVQNRGKKRQQFNEELKQDCLKMIKTSDEEFNTIPCCGAFSLHSSDVVKKLAHDYRSNKDRVIRSLRTSARKDSRYREAIAALTRPSRKSCKKSCPSITAEQRMPTDDLNLQSFEGSKETEFCRPSSSEEMGTSIEIKVNCHDAHIHGEDPSCCIEGDSAKSSEGLGKKLCPVSVNVRVDAQLFDVPISEGSDNTQTQNQGQAGNDRHLKFTFQRKRRKNVLGKVDQNIGLDRCFERRDVEQTIKAPLTGSGTLKDELNCDGGAMQVAHPVHLVPSCVHAK